MKFPITVNSVEWDDVTPIGAPLFGPKPGAWVSVRPVKDEKTYLGIMLGDYKEPKLRFDSKTGALAVAQSFLGNPAMWVFDLNRVVMGYESWWGEVKDENDLRKISDADIDNIWYVKAIRSLNPDMNVKTEDAVVQVTPKDEPE